MNSNARFNLQSGGDNAAIALDLFEQSMTIAERYPTNIVYSRNYDYQLEEYEQQIRRNRSKLFGNENFVDILDFGEGSENKGPIAKCWTSKHDLVAAGVHRGSNQSDPLCRFIFLSAPSSRDQLDVDHTLLTQILTWHQVMPEIIEFLLEFGISERLEVFHHSGFRSEMNLSQDSNRLALRTLGRSGREIRLCHILRTAERADSTGGLRERWPWVLRPTVTYHSFDIESQRSMWLVIKANSVIRDRVRSTCEDHDLYRLNPADNVDNTFESTLRTHLMLCAWASENWRWYISDIEEKVGTITREALTEDSPMPDLISGDERLKEKQGAYFSFKHVQHIHFLEEKANEGLLVLRSNVAVIHGLRDFYAEVALSLESTPECV